MTVEQPPAKQSTEEVRNPRGFAMRTGILFQTIGSAFLFGGCLLWSISGNVVTPESNPPQDWLGYFASRTSAAAWTVGVVTGFVGGLALASVGVGLHGERPSSGKLAVGVTAILFVLYALVAGVLVVEEGHWGAAIIPTVLSVVMLCLFLLALRCAHLFRRFPPPPHTEATEEILDEIRKQRAERRKYYDA